MKYNKAIATGILSAFSRTFASLCVFAALHLCVTTSGATGATPLSNERFRAVPHIIAVVLYSLLACLATWPLLFHFNTHFPAIPGEWGQDVWQHAWNIWWVKEALLVQHTNPYYTTMLFYPAGTSLYLHSLNLPVGLLGLPLLPFVGIVPTYNVLTLLVLVLTAYCSFLLARHVVGNDPAAIVTGSIAFCSPLRLFELRGAQLATLSDYAVPLTLLAVLIALEKRTTRSAFLVAGAVLLAGLSKWYHTFHLILVLVVLVLWRIGAAWRRGKQQALQHEMAPWLHMSLATMLIVSPFLIPGIIEALTQPYEPPVMIFNADPQRFLPTDYGWIWNPMPTDWWETYTFAPIPLLLALLGFILAMRQTSLWATIGIVCLILSMGTQTLHIGAIDTGIPLPYTLLHALPVVSSFRSPYRINSVTTLMIGLLAAYGLAACYRRLLPTQSTNQWVLALAITFLIAAESIRLPFPLDDASIAPFYSQIASQPGEWSVLEFPFNRVDRDRMEMYAQIEHRHPILTGKTSRNMVRMPYETIPPIVQVNAANIGTNDIVSLTTPERERLMRALRVRYLVVRPDLKRPGRDGRQVEVSRALFGPLTKVYADAELQAYRFDAVADWLDGPGEAVREEMPLFLGLDEQWEPLELDKASGDMIRWVPPDGAGFWTYAQHPRRAVLDVALYSLPGARPLEIRLNGNTIQTLPIADGARVRHYISSPINLPAGASLIELYAPRGGVSPQSLGLGDDPRPLSFRIHAVTLHEVQ